MYKSFSIFLTLLLTSFTTNGLELSGKKIPEIYTSGLTEAFSKAGDNAKELRLTFGKIKDEEVSGLAFLISHMPERDLTSLSSNYLAENIRYAYLARATFSWSKEIKEELFFNDVIPYASINERRDQWRKDFFKRFSPLVKKCKTPGEAAQILNKEMWSMVGVSYHATKRPKPDQSPYESIKAKYASCSGLSILLINACRSVGIPARFAGTPMWSNNRGNHSWVEVWDGKSWQFTGACEYNPAGLGKAWFAGNAAKAIKDNPKHAIYASSWEKATTHFPLVWDFSIRYVNAINVTERYSGKKINRVFIDILTRPGGKRVAANVEVFHEGRKIAAGKTRDSNNDTNDIFSIKLNSTTEHQIRIATGGNKVLVRKFYPSGKVDERIELFIEKDD